MYLSKFWAELRVQYREGEHFEAAEDANIQSLLNMSWKPRYPVWLFNTLSKYEGCLLWCCQLKKWVILPATSLAYWGWYALVSSLILTVGYGWLSPTVSFKICLTSDGLWYFLGIWWQVVMAMLQVQLGDEKTVVTAAMNMDVPWLNLWQLLHMGWSYVLFGLLISMIYRKITRS